LQIDLGIFPKVYSQRQSSFFSNHSVLQIDLGIFPKVYFFQKNTVRDKKITIHDKLIFSSETRSIMSLVNKKEREVHLDV